ncbi:PLP-dependent transferase [Nadsonia fulvescens var. elongata DSM 6958]|uniref:serine C-palmitoyltransferase n=1 Tax=Nadsonia fulvescens var. elongata DSM 6958 TaxID=857566 RepID=A0A1E3PEQ2_9ASCO|nr:PLP-dependent transferase [Nadsonia fulvescens var. elongata DSM 6958]
MAAVEAGYRVRPTKPVGKLGHLRDEEFGALTSPDYLYKHQHPPGVELPAPVEDEPPYSILIWTYLSYLVLILIGHIRDFFSRHFKSESMKDLGEHDGYAPLYSDFDSFYIRRLQHRIRDCFSRPTVGVPGRYITLINRSSNDYNNTFTEDGTTTSCLNLSSYNYLGFAQSVGQCTDAAEDYINEYGISSGASRATTGTLDAHVLCEDVVADFVGKESSMLFSMGYGTNASIFSSLVDKNCLVISDELNHASIRFGSRLSGAVIKIFKHNDMHDLEKLLREQISQGQPRTHRPWKKILLVVEGLYSMEGTMTNLPRLVELRKKYKFYLFVDEAHSVGAMGPRGRGVCDYFSIDTSNVDILMGTLTKSFGATGGFVAADKAIIDRIRLTNMGSNYAEAMSPPVLGQIFSSLKTITGEINPGEGDERLQRLAFNSRYLRLGLKRLGFIVYGIDDSPIIPLLLYQPSKMPAFSRLMLEKKIAVVVVGYPATPLTSSRVRFCLSSSLTKADLDELLAATNEIGDKICLKYGSGIASDSIDGKPVRWSLSDVIANGVEDCKKPLK